MISNVTKELETLTLDHNSMNQSIINKHVSKIKLFKNSLQRVWLLEIKTMVFSKL